jgi:hypothetical protein
MTWVLHDVAAGIGGIFAGGVLWLIGYLRRRLAAWAHPPE